MEALPSAAAAAAADVDDSEMSARAAETEMETAAECGEVSASIDGQPLQRDACGDVDSDDGQSAPQEFHWNLRPTVDPLSRGCSGSIANYVSCGPVHPPLTTAPVAYTGCRVNDNGGIADVADERSCTLGRFPTIGMEQQRTRLGRSRCRQYRQTSWGSTDAVSSCRLPPTGQLVAVALFSVTTLFATVCEGASYSAPSGARCSYIQNCVHKLAEYERHIAAGLITFTDSELETACITFDDIGVCVRRAQLACMSVNPTDEIKETWLGLNASFTYICKEARKVFLTYNKCYAQQSFTMSVKRCNKTYHMEKELTARTDDDVCRLTKTFLRCLHDTTKAHCLDETSAAFITTAVRLLRQPRMDFYSCTLDSSILRSSLCLVTTAVVIATYFVAMVTTTNKGGGHV